MDSGAEGGRSARVSVAVMAHRKRAPWAEALAEQLQCDVVWDRRNNVWDTASRAWQAHDPGATHHLVVQDDALLCSNLLEALPAIAEARPTSLISLMVSDPKFKPADLRRYQAAMVAGERWVPVWKGLPGVALMLPVRDIPSMLAFGHRDGSRHDDVKIMSFYRSRKLPAWFTVPSLVQHRDQSENPSLVSPDKGWRPRTSGSWAGPDFDATSVDWGVPSSVDPFSPRAFVNAQTGRFVIVTDVLQAVEMERASRWVEVDIEGDAVAFEDSRRP